MSRQPWNPEYGRAYRERKRLGVRSTHITTLPWEERFERKVDKVSHPGGCWLWLGGKDWRGYGIASRPEGRTTTAHRDAYEHLVGTVPPGLEVDHLCRVRACVNPDHLEVVTHAENMRRAAPWRVLPTSCQAGHAYTPENTRVTATRRECRTCRRTIAARYRARKRAAA